MSQPQFLPLDVLQVPLGGSTLIEASAGTGKTWTITGLYSRLILENGLRIDQILVVTYTKAATAELKTRIRARLTDCLKALERGEGDEFCLQLLETLSESLDEETLRQRLTRAIQGFDEAAIFTIHAFCQRVLVDSAFESGMDFELELLTHEDTLLAQVLADEWRLESAKAEGLWADFLLQQQETPGKWLGEISAHVGKPYQQLLALPNLPDFSGLEARMQQCFDDLQQLWLNQQDEVRELLADRSSLNGNVYREGTASKQFNALSDLLACGVVSLQGNSESIGKLAQSMLDSKVKKGKTAPQHALFGAVDGWLELQEELLDGYRLRLQHFKLGLLQRCDAMLDQRKKEQRLLSYNDLLNKLAGALDGPNGSKLAEQLAARYQAALVDEFQDTDPVQYRIFSRIYQATDLPFFMVGDPKQAIYSFRGADLFSYLTARESARAHYTLTVNQRSVAGLIEACNALFQPANLSRTFLAEQIDYHPVDASPRDKGQLMIDSAGEHNAALRFMQWPTGTDSKGKSAAVSKGAANGIAVEGCAEEIVRLLNLAETQQAKIVTGGQGRALHGGDIAVLVATHHQGRLIQQALTGRGVPAVRQGQDDVLTTIESVELLQVLQAIAEPTQQSLLRAALVTSIWGYDGQQLAELAENESAWETVLENVQRLHQLWLDAGFMAMFRQWLADNSVAPRLLGRIAGERSLTNLLHLAELIQLESRRLKSIEQQIAWLAQQQRLPQHDEISLLRLESDARRVKIVTIHSSKGLEYPIVFCPFLWDGDINYDKATFVAFHDPQQDFRACLDGGSAGRGNSVELAEQESLAERLRLLYVALTRAKHRCYVPWGQSASKGKNSHLATAALSWLLYAQDELLKGGHPVAAMRDLFECGMEDNDFFAPLQQLAAWQSDNIYLSAISGGQTRWLGADRRDNSYANLAVRELQREQLRARWRMTSFSGLTAGKASELPDYDAMASVPAVVDVDENSFFAFPRGAGPGNCLHAIFENWDFTSTDREALAELVQRKLKVFAIEERWTPVVVEQVLLILNHPMLPEPDLKLAELPRKQRQPEMEFTYPLEDLQLAELQALLADPALGLPEEFRERLAHLGFSRVKGYLKGFIDLVFEADGRFYLVDYKSNWLGGNFNDYDQDVMQQAIAHEHYYLQFLVYSVALHRYLTLRKPDYDFQQHFGGAYYLFLRGIQADATQATGIYFFRPEQHMVEQLADFLTGAAP